MKKTNGTAVKDPGSYLVQPSARLFHPCCYGGQAPHVYTARLYSLLACMFALPPSPSQHTLPDQHLHQNCHCVLLQLERVQSLQL